MNYMKMIHFVHTSSTEVTSKFIYKESEEFSEVDKPFIVPSYLILEAMFQTAGKVAREYSNHQSGGSIVSFGNWHFKRPVFSNETMWIRAQFLSFHPTKRCFFIKVSMDSDSENIITSGEVIIMQDQSIENQYLNNTDLEIKSQILSKMGL